MPAYSNLFKKYLHRIFIETGSYQGDGIQMALDAGYEKVYSIELAEALFLQCSERFQDNLNVRVIFGDSANELPKLLKDIDEPVTFWLDGHWSWGETARGETDSPLIKELEAIREHHIKTHTIMIDDLRCWTLKEQGFNVKSLMNIALTINPAYRFTIEDGLSRKQVFYKDILVCHE
jgi:hypothetical protein